MSVKVLVADDHEVVRRGLASLLSGTDIKIVAEAKSGDEAVKLTKKHKPDVVLLDIRMPDSDGLEALERIRRDRPEQRVVMLSTYDNPTYVARAVAQGGVRLCAQGLYQERTGVSDQLGGCWTAGHSHRRIASCSSHDGDP